MKKIDKDIIVVLCLILFPVLTTARQKLQGTSENIDSLKEAVRLVGKMLKAKAKKYIVQQLEKLKELDEAKSRFFTNLSQVCTVSTKRV